ncbi:MAG: hypothetical protein HKO53_19320 [Gemmatimonadetes bacterium]|nr:hypothetical protein [Gemmatimonadota bacterium]
MAALARPDKWVLSGLDGIVWAPPFPKWLDRPGFWDPVHILHYELGPLFSVALLDASGGEISLERLPPGSDAWRPDRLVTEWRFDRAAGGELGQGPRLGEGSAHRPVGPRSTHPPVATEVRRVLPGGLVESEWRIPAGAAVTVAAFTAQPVVGTIPSGATATGTESMTAVTGGLSWERTVTDRKGECLHVRCRLEIDASPSQGSIATALVPSQGAALPCWELSPFAETWAPPAPASANTSAADRPSWHWGAVHVGLDPATSEHRVTIRLRIEPDVRLPSAHALGWREFWSAFPAFGSGDPHLDRYFDARVFGLGLNRVAGVWPNIGHPAIAEGIGYFHIPITYSAQCHMMETRWRGGGDEAWGSILNFLEHQKSDGSLHGRLYPNHLSGTDYYHANWGDAVRAVFALHPDRNYLSRAYSGLTQFAEWLRRERDPESSGMFTVVNHYETGQEYMSRYVTVDPEADVNEWQPRLRLKGIDVTVYAYQLFRALEWMAAELGRTEDEPEWAAAAAHSGMAMLDRMWSPEAGLFTDIDGDTGQRTDIKAAVGFYPLLTDLPSSEQVGRMLRHLDDPNTFGTPFPIPSSSVDDAHFSAEGVWKGMRRNCPWNGRVWPMTTSHLIEGLLRRWRQGDTAAGTHAVSTLTRFVRMMFDGGDPTRPNCFEHYNPFTGRACYFRGIDDYQHSWVIDLMIRGLAGLHPSEDGVTLHPLPHELPEVTAGPVLLRGARAQVWVTGDAVGMRTDTRSWEGERGRPLTVGWDELGLG